MPTEMPRNFNVCVYLLSGSELRIASDGQEESIVDFKKRLAQKTGMDHFGQRLFDSDNKELLNLQTLSEAGVRCGSVLRCVFDADQPPELVSSSSDGEVGKSARRVGKSARRVDKIDKEVTHSKDGAGNDLTETKPAFSS